MGRSNQKKGGTNQNYRKESRDERRIRMKEQQEARERCFKMLPYAGGAIVIFFLLFAIYVRSVPPKTTFVPPKKQTFVVQPDDNVVQPDDGAQGAIKDILKGIPNAKVVLSEDEIKSSTEEIPHEEATPPMDEGLEEPAESIADEL